MHDLTERAHLREIVMNLKLDHKEILFFLYIITPKRLLFFTRKGNRSYDRFPLVLAICLC